MATDQQEHLKIEQLAHQNPDEQEVAAGRERLVSGRLRRPTRLA